MAVLRPDQSQLTFMGETSAGADADQLNALVVDNATTFATDSGSPTRYNPGDSSIRVNAIGTIDVGDFIVIGAYGGSIVAPDNGCNASIKQREIRRIEHIDPDSSGTKAWLHLDRPLALTHYITDGHSSATSTPIARVTTSSEGVATKHIRFAPGVYDTVDTPDPVMAIEPRYFLGTQAKRNFTSIYAGQRTFQGALNGVILLNGWPLRWGIGKEIPLARGTAAFTNDMIVGESFVGNTWLKLGESGTAGTPALSVGDYISINHVDAGFTFSNSTTLEINQVKTAVTNAWVELEHPLKYGHAAGEHVRKITATDGITHYIVEQNDLSSISMHLAMLDSDQTSSTRFERRWVGGKVGAMSIIAEEGGLVTCNWDSVIFKDMLHNQMRQYGVNRYPDASTTLTTPTSAASSQGSGVSFMPGFTIMNTMNTADVVLPETQPYYFSGGTIKMMDGTEFARVRSFTLSINNNEDPRYYIGSRYGDHKGPSEIREQRREYTISCTVALPDTQDVDYNTDQNKALSLFNELLLEGRYSSTSGHAGFDLSLKFVRGNFQDSGARTWEDAIWIHIPGVDQSSTNRFEGSTGSPAGTLIVPGDSVSQTSQGTVNRGGAFIRSAPHTISTEAPFQVALDMVFRSMTIVVRDKEPYYP